MNYDFWEYVGFVVVLALYGAWYGFLGWVLYLIVQALLKYLGS